MITNDDNEPIANINVTPFVDIILVVLIIFMVTTPMLVRSSLEVQLPQAASGMESTPSPIHVTLDQYGQIDLNGQRVTQEQLQNEVLAITQTNPNTQAIISADENTPHGTVIAIIDAVKTAGVSQLAIGVQ